MTAQSYAAARPSATVVVVRESDAAPEILLVQRSAKTSFASTFVFPGGILDDVDHAVGAYCQGVDETSANRMLGTADGGIAYFSAAIRELFEETGLLLARKGEDWIDSASLGASRAELNAGRLRWPDFLASNDLTIAGDALQYFSFWVTPRELDKRYSARFFLALAPADQAAVHCGEEVTAVRWLTAAEALDEAAAARLELPRPTAATLQWLRSFSAIPALLEAARERNAAGVPCVRPAVVTVDGRRRIVMPDHAEYPQYPDAGCDD